MKLAISNIAWSDENDDKIYGMMKKNGFCGLEIAPTRIFSEKPYEKLEQAEKWYMELSENYGFEIPSMQSIWFGRQEKIFGSNEERAALLDYTKKAIDFAESIKCHNLVFGCPKNRNVPEGADKSIAVPFFRELGEYALKRHTVVGMEANPPIYNTNYINDTASAIELIKEVHSEGFKLNLDIGTMIQNEEDIMELEGNISVINHVHISEPGLKLIEKRELHRQLRECLENGGYQGFISIEMGRQDDVSDIEKIMLYVKEIFE